MLPADRQYGHVNTLFEKLLQARLSGDWSQRRRNRYGRRSHTLFYVSMESFVNARYRWILIVSLNVQAMMASAKPARITGKPTTISAKDYVVSTLTHACRPFWKLSCKFFRSVPDLSFPENTQPFASLKVGLFLKKPGDERSESPGMRHSGNTQSFIDAFDVSAECGEFGFDMLVTSVDVIDPADGRGSLCRQARKDKRRRRS